jgi:hypothetical protein
MPPLRPTDVPLTLDDLYEEVLRLQDQQTETATVVRQLSELVAATLSTGLTASARIETLAKLLTQLLELYMNLTSPGQTDRGPVYLPISMSGRYDPGHPD